MDRLLLIPSGQGLRPSTPKGRGNGELVAGLQDPACLGIGDVGSFDTPQATTVDNLQDNTASIDEDEPKLPGVPSGHPGMLARPLNTASYNGKIEIFGTPPTHRP